MAFLQCDKKKASPLLCAVNILSAPIVSIVCACSFVYTTPANVQPCVTATIGTVSIRRPPSRKHRVYDRFPCANACEDDGSRNSRLSCTHTHHLFSELLHRSPNILPANREKATERRTLPHGTHKTVSQSQSSRKDLYRDGFTDRRRVTLYAKVPCAVRGEEELPREESRNNITTTRKKNT